MWRAMQPFDFESTHGAFVGTDVRDRNIKARVLESMKIQARSEGWQESSTQDISILRESI